MTDRKYKPAPCHPERNHIAKGLCSQCYWAMRLAEPEFRERRRKYAAEYYAEARKEPAVYERMREQQRSRRRFRLSTEAGRAKNRARGAKYRAKRKAEKTHALRLQQLRVRDVCEPVRTGLAKTG